METVIFHGVMIGVLGFAIVAQLPDPFDSYAASIKKNQTQASTTEFAKRCGVPMATRRHALGVNVEGDWTPAADLAKALADVQTDFFSSAEVSEAPSGAAVVNLWSLALDVGSEENTLFCLDPHGHPRFLAATSWSIPVDGSKGGWAYVQQRTFDEEGKLIRKTGHFIDRRNRVVQRPQLDEGESKHFDAVPDFAVATQIIAKLKPR